MPHWNKLETLLTRHSASRKAVLFYLLLLSLPPGRLSSLSLLFPFHPPDALPFRKMRTRSSNSKRFATIASSFQQTLLGSQKERKSSCRKCLDWFALPNYRYCDRPGQKWIPGSPNGYQHPRTAKKYIRLRPNPIRTRTNWSPMALSITAFQSNLIRLTSFPPLWPPLRISAPALSLPLLPVSKPDNWAIPVHT